MCCGIRTGHEIHHKPCDSLDVIERQRGQTGSAIACGFDQRIKRSLTATAPAANRQHLHRRY